MSFGEDSTKKTGMFTVTGVDILDIKDPTIIVKSFSSTAKAKAWLGHSSICHRIPKNKPYTETFRRDGNKTKYYVRIIKELQN